MIDVDRDGPQDLGQELSRRDSARHGEAELREGRAQAELGHEKKTAFAEVLAEALDRELVARQASDLLSPYVGETEQNLARLFGEIDPSLGRGFGS